MGAFLGISLWIALATVVPGLVTIAGIYGALVVINPERFSPYLSKMGMANDWIWAGIAITIMVLTQALGILLEGLFVRRKLLGPESLNIEIPEGIDPHGETNVILKPYFEYQGLYILLAELREEEDTQGHLKRALAQFFLTNNTLISFLVGIIVAEIMVIVDPTLTAILKGGIFILILLGCLWVTYRVARIRFEVMAKALWAARRRRLQIMKNHKLPG